MQAWSDGPEGSRNIGLRVAQNIIGLDVDAYGEKTGDATLADLESRLGELPGTYRSTSRGAENPSGIRFFRVPADRHWMTKLDGIEIIQYGHRYAVVWPSIHPEGREYRWYDCGDESCDGPPEVNDLPELPEPWVRYLDQGEFNAPRDALPEDIAETVRRLAGDDGEPCSHLGDAGVRAYKNRGRGTSRHDVMCSQVMILLNKANEGHSGVYGRLVELQERFNDDLANEPRAGRPDPTEFVRAVSDGLRRLGPPSNSCLDGITTLHMDEPTPSATRSGGRRRLKVTRASEKTVKRPRWVWHQRIPVGEMTLLAGREGIGKSTMAYQLSADVTQGRLDGEYKGAPRTVIVVATEDSWEHTPSLPASSRPVRTSP